MACLNIYHSACDRSTHWRLLIKWNKGLPLPTQFCPRNHRSGNLLQRTSLSFPFKVAEKEDLFDFYFRVPHSGASEFMRGYGCNGGLVLQ